MHVASSNIAQRFFVANNSLRMTRNSSNQRRTRISGTAVPAIPNSCSRGFQVICFFRLFAYCCRVYIDFYRAMLCIRGTSHGPVSVSVCLSVSVSVTSRCSTKMAKQRITQTTPHDSSGTLVFCRQRSPRNSTGVTPYDGAECRWGGSKSATFD